MKQLTSNNSHSVIISMIYAVIIGMCLSPESKYFIISVISTFTLYMILAIKTNMTLINHAIVLSYIMTTVCSYIISDYFISKREINFSEDIIVCYFATILFFLTRSFFNKI